MLRCISLFFAAVFLLGKVAIADNQSQGVLANAKFSGACGIMIQMFMFQETTKMPGGNEFLERFWHTEMARLGYSQDEYIAQCKRSVELHDIMMNEMGKDND